MKARYTPWVLQKGSHLHRGEDPQKQRGDLEISTCVGLGTILAQKSLTPSPRNGFRTSSRSIDQTVQGGW